MIFKNTLKAFSTVCFLLLVACDGTNKQESEIQESTVDAVTESKPTEQPNNAEVSELVTYTVATVSTYPPFATKNSDGNFTGFDIDLLKAIAEAEGFQLTFVVKNWKDWKQDIAENNVDIWAAGIAEKEDRKEFVDFTESYLNYESNLLTLDDTKYNNINAESIKTLQIGVEKGTTDVDLATSLVGSSNVIEFKSNSIALEGLIQKNIDGIIGNKLVIAGISQQFPEVSFKFNTLPNDDTEDKKLAFMIQKGNSELQEKLDHGLETVKSNGTFHEIEKKWFGNLAN